jgi:hypothetical protein
MNAPKTTIHFVKAFTCTVPVWVDGKSMNAPKTTIHFVKAFTCTVPVWVDGKRTEDTEERVKALFVARLAGISRGTFGSCFMEPNSTIESVESAWSTDYDYSEHLRMQPVEGSDFAKVVVK